MTAFRIFAAGRREPRKGHRHYLDLLPAMQSHVDYAQIEAVRHERARRRLYSGCDRAPLGWEKALP